MATTEIVYVNSSQFLRAMNAAIKRQFADRVGLLPAKCSFTGSFFSCRFEGSMPIDLAHDISRFVFDETTKHVKLERAGGDYRWHMDGTVMSFRVLG